MDLPNPATLGKISRQARMMYVYMYVYANAQTLLI